MIRASALLLAGALLAMPAPARADQRFARYDLELSRHILSLSALLTRSSGAFQDWSNGRLTTPEAQARLQDALRQARLEGNALKREAAPSGLGALASAAQQYARSQTAVIDGACHLVKAGTPDQAALRRFLDESLSGTRLSQHRWFQIRLLMMPRALAAPLSAGARRFYRWQSAWLPIWREESESSSQVEQLLSGYRRDTADQSAKDALELVRRALALRERGARVPAPPALVALQACAVDELAGMATVCEAVSSLLDDPGSDSVDRLHRTVAEAIRRSQEVERQSLKALAEAIAAH